MRGCNSILVVSWLEDGYTKFSIEDFRALTARKLSVYIIL